MMRNIQQSYFVTRPPSLHPLSTLPRRAWTSYLDFWWELSTIDWCHSIPPPARVEMIAAAWYLGHGLLFGFILVLLLRGWTLLFE